MVPDEVSRRLARIPPFSRAQLVPFLVASLVLVCDGQEMLIMSFVDMHLKRVWGLTPAMEGALGACVFGGILVGSVASGLAADRVGRRPTILLFFTLVLLFGAASAFAPSFAWLVLLRAATGIGIGGTIPTCNTLIAEVFPRASRATAMLLLSTGFVVGECITALEAMHIKMDEAHRDGWRWLLGLSAAPATIGVCVAWMWLRESPRFFKARGRIAEMRKELDWMEAESEKGLSCCGGGDVGGKDVGGGAGGEGDDGAKAPLVDEDGTDAAGADGTAVEGEVPPSDPSSLLKRLMEVLGWGEAFSMWWVWLVVSLVYYGVVWILPTTLNEGDGSTNATLPSPPDGNATANTVAAAARFQHQQDLSLKVLGSALAELPSIIIPVYLVDRMGRRHLLNASMGLCVAFAGLSAVFAPAIDVSGARSGAAVAARQTPTAWFLFSVMTLKCMISVVFSVIYIYTAEAVPTHVRATAVGVGSAMSRVGGMVTPIVTSTLHATDIASPYWFFFAASLSGLAAGCMLRGVGGDEMA